MSEHGAQAINRALSILRCFTVDRGAISLKEICRQTGLTHSTGHRMVKTLQAAGFLVHVPESGGYALGPTVMDLAHAVLARSDHSDLVSSALPQMERLRSRTGETVAVHVRIGVERVCLAEFPSRHPLRVARGVGHTAPLHAGAAGKVLLAWLPREQRGALLSATPLRRLTAGTIVETDVLEEELARVRHAGYAVSVGETVEGAAAIAVPVFGPGGTIRAAIAVTGPSSRWTEQRIGTVCDEVVRQVASIELASGRAPASR